MYAKTLSLKETISIASNYNLYKQITKKIFLKDKISQSSISENSKLSTVILSDKETVLLNEEDVFNKFYGIYENNAKNEEIITYLEDNPNPDKAIMILHS